MRDLTDKLSELSARAAIEKRDLSDAEQEQATRYQKGIDKLLPAVEAERAERMAYIEKIVARGNPNNFEEIGGPELGADGKPIRPVTRQETAPGLLRSYDPADAPQWGDQFIAARADAQRALLDSGSVPVSVPLAPEPVVDGRQARFVYQLSPTRDAPGGHFAYMQQITRTINAAVVAAGALKPESIFTLRRQDDTTKVIAHVSEPINRFDLEDAAILSQFLNQEMLYGLNRATDDHVVSEIAALATDGSATPDLAGIRSAITTLQVIDLSPTAIVINPTDWEDVEAEANSAFAGTDRDMGTDAMNRRLYSVAVMVSNSIAAGQVLVGDFTGSAVMYRTGSASISLHDSQPRDVNGTDYADYRLNQLVVRAELRAEVAVTRPAGFVRLGAGS